MTSKEQVLEIYPTAHVQTACTGFGIRHTVMAYTEDCRRIEFWGRPAHSSSSAWSEAWNQIQQQLLDSLTQ